MRCDAMRCDAASAGSNGRSGSVLWLRQWSKYAVHVLICARREDPADHQPRERGTQRTQCGYTQHSA